MSVIQLLDLKTGVSFGVFLFILLLTVIQVTPIKLNPWDKILTWLGNHMNADIVKRVDVIEGKLDEHIRDSANERIRKTRADILVFGNECMRGTPHTKEQFDFVLSECDQYEEHMESTNTPNGVAKATIKEIRRLYAKNLRDNTFLKEGADGRQEKEERVHGSFIAVFLSGKLCIDTSAVSVIVPSAYGELAVHTGFVIWKAKNENARKYRNVNDESEGAG